ncbi:hypothetical protein TWF281_004220 [Arthrobotrys megalospora]
MAIPAIPGPILPCRIKHYVSNLLNQRRQRKKQKRERSTSNDGGSNRRRRGRFDMGHYLHLTSPMKLSIPPDFTSDVKTQLKALKSEFTPCLDKLKALYARFSRSKFSDHTANQTPAADATPVITVGAKPPITKLPTSILLKTMQYLPITTLPSLLCVNKTFRTLILENYHLILNYPRTIASKYEFLPLTLLFPDWWTLQNNQTSRLSQFFNAWWRVRIYEDCYIVLAEVLADEYVGYWRSAAGRNPRLRDAYEEVLEVGWEALKGLVLAELVKESFERGVNEQVGVYLEGLVPDGYKGVMRGQDDKGKKKAGVIYDWDEDSIFKELGGDAVQTTSQPTERLMAEPTGVLKQALTYAVHKTVREEINYSFPAVKVEKLHPVQILELMRVRVPPWSWSQEDQVERVRRLFVMSAESRGQIERYREEWGAMRGVVEGVIRAGL